MRAKVCGRQNHGTPSRANQARASLFSGTLRQLYHPRRETSSTRPYKSASSGNLPTSESVDRGDYSKFVRFLHLASPYVVGHRSRVFVIVIPGHVFMRKDRLVPILEDILLLHGLGVRVVIVAGARELIDHSLRQIGRGTGWRGGYRVTDTEVMRLAIEAAGTVSTEITGTLSRAPSVPMVRRHARGEGKFQFAPAVHVITGNYVSAKRRGIVNGLDFGFMGQVRSIQSQAIKQQLDSGNIILLTNIGVSAGGELLNCNSYDVATHAAVELQADKLLCLTGDDVRQLKLPHYLPLDDAEALIQESICSGDATGECIAFSPGTMTAWEHRSESIEPEGWSATLSTAQDNKSNGAHDAGNRKQSSESVEMLLDLDSWQQIGFPNAVVAAVVVCKYGVKRAHLIDADRDGAMLLELYTRDGITGVCMIAADLYEGIRPAEVEDSRGITRLLAILAEEGYDLPFRPMEAADHLHNITVVAREGRVMGCAVICDLGLAPDGIRVGELSAFIIDPSFRRQGLGDSLLDYVEQDFRRKGFQRIVLIAEQGSYEWFNQRAFELTGEASISDLLPIHRRSQVPSKVAKLFAKPILELDESLDATPGKRIGF